MRSIKTPERMTPEERLHEVAAILAAGFLRLRRRRGYLPGAASSDAEPRERPEENSRN